MSSCDVPFLKKLWEMLENRSLSHLICWSRSGDTFCIMDVYEFSHGVLHRYFKSSAMASFVRQLNIYGFKKISSVDRSGTNNFVEQVEYAHPHFRRDQPHLARRITRKCNGAARRPSAGCEADSPKAESPATENLIVVPESDWCSMLDELQSLRVSNAHLQSNVAGLSKDNATLWGEVSLLRDGHAKQQQNVSRLVQFLISLMHQPAGHHHHGGGHAARGMAGAKRSIAQQQNLFPQDHPLAVQAIQTQQSWDILGAIQQDILSDELTFNFSGAGGGGEQREVPAAGPRYFLEPEASGSGSSSSGCGPVALVDNSRRLAANGPYGGRSQLMAPAAKRALPMAPASSPQEWATAAASPPANSPDPLWTHDTLMFDPNCHHLSEQELMILNCEEGAGGGGGEEELVDGQEAIVRGGYGDFSRRQQQ